MIEKTLPSNKDRHRPIMTYSLYILRCADGTYYTGITTDVTRRIGEHNGRSRCGAKYTASRRPVTLVYEDNFPSRSTALKEELRVKKLTRAQKQDLISGLT
jgi:putative endonuclease